MNAPAPLYRPLRFGVTRGVLTEGADGVRYVIPGDFALLEEDGSITMLGRDQSDTIHQVRRGTERRSPLIDLRGLESIGTLEDCP